MTFSQSSLSNSISAPHIPLQQHLKGWGITLLASRSFLLRLRSRRTTDKAESESARIHNLLTPFGAPLQGYFLHITLPTGAWLISF